MLPTILVCFLLSVTNSVSLAQDQPISQPNETNTNRSGRVFRGVISFDANGNRISTRVRAGSDIGINTPTATFGTIFEGVLILSLPGFNFNAYTYAESYLASNRQSTNPVDLCAELTGFFVNDSSISMPFPKACRRTHLANEKAVTPTYNGNHGCFTIDFGRTGRSAVTKSFHEYTRVKTGVILAQGDQTVSANFNCTLN